MQFPMLSIGASHQFGALPPQIQAKVIDMIREIAVSSGLIVAGTDGSGSMMDIQLLLERSIEGGLWMQLWVGFGPDVRFNGLDTPPVPLFIAEFPEGCTTS